MEIKENSFLKKISKARQHVCENWKQFFIAAVMFFLQPLAVQILDLLGVKGPEINNLINSWPVRGLVDVLVIYLLWDIGNRAVKAEKEAAERETDVRNQAVLQALAQPNKIIELHKKWCRLNKATDYLNSARRNLMTMKCAVRTFKKDKTSSYSDIQRSVHAMQLHALNDDIKLVISSLSCFEGIRTPPKPHEQKWIIYCEQPTGRLSHYEVIASHNENFFKEMKGYFLSVENFVKGCREIIKTEMDKLKKDTDGLSA